MLRVTTDTWIFSPEPSDGCHIYLSNHPLDAWMWRLPRPQAHNPASPLCSLKICRTSTSNAHSVALSSGKGGISPGPVYFPLSQNSSSSSHLVSWVPWKRLQQSKPSWSLARRHAHNWASSLPLFSDTTPLALLLSFLLDWTSSRERSHIFLFAQFCPSIIGVISQSHGLKTVPRVSPHIWSCPLHSAFCLVQDHSLSPSLKPLS